MKKFIALTMFVLMALSMLMVGVVSAEDLGDGLTDLNVSEEYEELEEDPGTTPDSVFYGLDRAMERISLALTFNKAAKAQKGLEHARERLLEVRAMIQEKKAAHASRARQGYEDAVEGVGEAVEGMDEDSDEDVIEGVVGDLAELRALIQENEMAIEALMNQLSDENLTDEDRAALEAELAELEAATEELKAQAEQRREEVKDRWRAVSGMNASEVEDAEDEIEAETGAATKSQRLAAKWIERTENALEKLKARLDLAQQELPEEPEEPEEPELPGNETEEPEEPGNETETPEGNETESANMGAASETEEEGEEESESEEEEEEESEEEEEEPETEEEPEEEGEEVSPEPISEEQASSIEEYIATLEAKLAEAKAAYAAGDYEQVLAILKPINNFGRQINVAVRLRNIDRLQKLKEAKVRTEAKLEAVKAKLEQRRERILSKVDRVKNNLKNGKNQVDEEPEEPEEPGNETEGADLTATSNKGRGRDKDK